MGSVISQRLHLNNNRALIWGTHFSFSIRIIQLGHLYLGEIEYINLKTFLIALLKTNKAPFMDKKVLTISSFFWLRLDWRSISEWWFFWHDFKRLKKTEEEVQCKTIWRETIWSNLESSKNHLNGTFYKLNYDYGKELVFDYYYCK